MLCEPPNHAHPQDLRWRRCPPFVLEVVRGEQVVVRLTIPKGRGRRRRAAMESAIGIRMVVESQLVVEG